MIKIKGREKNIPQLRTSILAGAFIIMSLPASLFYNGQSAAGDLDATFGSGGKVITSVGDSSGIIKGMLIQSDGKIVVAGQAFFQATGSDFGLARYNIDGSLDTNFGNGGKVSTNFNSNSLDEGLALALQPDGKFVVAGRTLVSQNDSDFALARYNSDGSLDSGFGIGGKVITPLFSNEDQANSLAIQQDGKIVVAGKTLTSSLNADFALARYNIDGSLDTSFGTGGKVLTDFFGDFDQATTLLIQSDGKIVAAGSAGGFFAFARYNTNGSPDNTLNTNGQSIYFSIFGEIGAIVKQNDGKIIAAGQVTSGSPTVFAVTRFNNNGTLDSSFGNGGITLTDFGGDSWATAVALQPDGRIVAAGISTSNNFGIARYQNNGSPDLSFGTAGKIVTDFFGSFDYAFAVAVQSDGKIIAAGGAVTGTGNFAFALARYLGASSFDACIEDDSTHDVLLFNSTTGDYQFKKCGSNLVLEGVGSVTKRGCTISLQVNATDRRIQAKVDTCSMRASASVQYQVQGLSFSLIDRNITNNICSCSSQ
jgi:uncharacterized delta-60 repeat protein